MSAPDISALSQDPTMTQVAGFTPGQGPQAAPAPHSVWANVVSGALHGLLGGAASGAGAQGFTGGLRQAQAIGQQQSQLATQNSQEQQKIDTQKQLAQSTIQFQSLQAAHMAAEDANQVTMRRQEEESIGLERDKGAQHRLEYNTSLYGPPSSITNLDPNDKADTAQHAALTHAATLNGGIVPPMDSIQIGNKVYNWDANAMAGNPAMKKERDAAAYLISGGADKGMPQQNWIQLNAEQKLSERNRLINVLDATKPLGAGDVDNALQTIKGIVERAPKDADPNMLGMAKAQQKVLQATHDQALQDKVTVAREGAQARQEVKNAATPQWVPGASADEKKKAELGENMAENTYQAAQLIAKRPDILGAVAGRFTQADQMIGNNDPDISKLGTIISNIAKANSGVHGLRSNEANLHTEQLILNNFKNGPAAVAGALRANMNSAQTFIDNARPADYKTHSKQGGAYKAYVAEQSGQ